MGGAQSKGAWTPLVSKKISTSASNNYKIVPVADQACESYGDTFDVPQGYLECRWVNGKKLRWIKINKVKQTFVNKVSPQGIEPCKLKNKDVTVTQGDIRSQGLKVGFPFDNTFKHGVYAKGTNEVLIVGIDFPELRGDGTLEETMAEDKKWMQDWFRYYSSDQSKFNVTTIDNWISAPKSAASYIVTGNDGNSSSSNRFLAEASQPFVDLITQKIDLRKFNTVYMMFPDGEINFDMDLIVRNERFKIKEGEMNMNFFGWGHDNELMETLRWAFYVHETLHDFDIIGHAPGNGWPFGIFTNQSGISMAMNPYEQFLLDWLPQNQIYCVDAKTLTEATVSLTPMEREDSQTKMAMIKLSPTRVIVVESHGIDKWSMLNKGDRSYPPGFYGVMAYVVDLDKTAAPPVTADGRSLSNEEYAWAMWQKVEGGKSTDYEQSIGMRPDMHNAVAVLGDSFLIDGIQIKLVGTGDFETIEIKNLTPTPAIVEPKEIKSFQDAVDRPKDVSYWAWKKSSDQLQSNNSKGPIVELMIGPNTTLSNPDAANAISAVSKLYPEFKSPEKVFAIYYSYPDIDWAQKKYAEVYESANGQEAKNSCQKIEFCWGASATINRSGNGVILAAVMTSNPDRNHTSGTLEAHEYTHVLQISSFYGTENQNRAMCCIKAFAPWWFVEGGAHFSQFATIYAKSFAKYSEERKNETSELLTNRDKKYTEKWLANFIKPPDTSAWREDGRESFHLYDLGMLVSEVFTAIKGPAINIQIFTDISKGMTFEKSFEDHFGLPWDDAAKMIAKSISLLVEN